ncbi:ATP-binding protein [Streptomyces sp. BSE7-9]|uniref:ATP-binding protein n=1 Tax=Streptomyces sp. BSE7-9 TaxID=2759948 RepID=UPI001E381AFF|nr:ATP-binding protein [Streptomyces sp. BSE7-9]
MTATRSDRPVNGHNRPGTSRVGPTDRGTSRPAHGKPDDGGKQPPAAARIVAMAREEYRFVMSTDGRPYAVALDGPNVAVPLRGKAGLRQRLARRFADAYPGEVASQSALADAMTVLEGIAEDNDPVPVNLRVGRAPDGAIVVDLGSADGRAVVVSGLGWQVVERSPVLFRRSGAMAPMPEPVLDGDGLAKLHALLNMDESAFHQLVAWLVAAWIPDIPHPAVVCKGEQGTGKSKAAQMFINLIDPSPAAKRSQPRDEKAWSRQAFSSWALCLDNVSTIPPWLSDTLCKAVTGDGVVDRALYTDDDVVVLTFKRVLAMTTIDAGALAGDLAERVLLLDLQLIDSRRRRSEEELDATFEAVRPAVLGALFDVLACALAVLPSVRLEAMPRMADFARARGCRPDTGLEHPGRLPGDVGERRHGCAGRRPVRHGHRDPGRPGGNVAGHGRAVARHAARARPGPATELAQGRHPCWRAREAARTAVAVHRDHRGRHAA